MAQTLAERTRVHRIWARKNKVKRSAYAKEWRKKNRAKWSAHRSKYYRESVKPKLTKAWKARMREYQRAWHIKNKDKVRAGWQRRYALRKLAEVGDTEVIKKWIAAWQKKRTVKCYWCSRRLSPKKTHVDHITPISGGGKHAVENLCISCRHCNISKHGKTLTLWNTDLSQPVLL